MSIAGMTFEQALTALKAGHMVRRSGWNGKTMHIYLEDKRIEHLNDGIFKGSIRQYEPVLCIYTSNATHQPGWLPTQADLLTDDWHIVAAAPAR